MPAKLGAIITKKVQSIWGAHPEWTGVRVHREIKRLNGGAEPLSVRLVQEIIHEAKTPAGETFKPYPLIEWEPWFPKRNPETSAFLLTMDAVCQAVQSRPLYEHEAKWGMRLRVTLEGLTPYDQFCFVAIYAQREVVNFHLNEPERGYADLNVILAYKPWLPENAHAYGTAIMANLSLLLLPGIREELSSEDAVETSLRVKPGKRFVWTCGPLGL